MMMINENKLGNKKCTRDRESIKLGCECTHRLGDTLNSNPNVHDLTHNYTTTMRMVRRRYPISPYPFSILRAHYHLYLPITINTYLI